jgi:class 3 adenylate cyclase
MPDDDIKTHLAAEAVKIVTGARRGAYGEPELNFERIARYWTAHMQNTGRAVVITAADVSPMMRLMKEARLDETPDHYDSHLDLIGYALTGAEVNGVKVP